MSFLGSKVRGPVRESLSFPKGSETGVKIAFSDILNSFSDVPLSFFLTVGWVLKIDRNQMMENLRSYEEQLYKACLPEYSS